MPLYREYTIHNIKEKFTWIPLQRGICTKCAEAFVESENAKDLTIEPDKFRSKYGDYTTSPLITGLQLVCSMCSNNIPFNLDLDI